MIYLVCPFFRPKMARQVWENFEKQTHPCRLVIVENGPGVGAFTGMPADVVVLHSEPGVGRARQVGLEYVRAADGDYLALDDDDFYGPHYVAEWAANAHRATVVGKYPHHILMPDGKIWLYNRHRANTFSDDVIGGNTFGFRARCAVDFPDTNATNDTDWCNLMRAEGATFWCTGLQGHVYNRAGGDHTSPGSEKLFRDIWGGREGPFTFAEAGV